MQYNEKRSGTAISLTDCDLIVITKTIYLALIEDSKIEMLASDLLKGRKESFLKFSIIMRISFRFKESIRLKGKCNENAVIAKRQTCQS